MGRKGLRNARLAGSLGLVILLGGCSLLRSGVTLTQTANDAIACMIGVTNEVSAGIADPAFQALGHSPTAAEIAAALEKAQAMLPGTVAACAALASDFDLSPTTVPVTPPKTAAETPGGIKVGNPWRR